jgi:hypothetical protein
VHHEKQESTRLAGRLKGLDGSGRGDIHNGIPFVRSRAQHLVIGVVRWLTWTTAAGGGYGAEVRACKVQDGR